MDCFLLHDAVGTQGGKDKSCPVLCPPMRQDNKDGACFPKADSPLLPPNHGIV